MTGCMQSCRFKMGIVEGQGCEGPRMRMGMWLKVLVLRPGEGKNNIDKGADGPREWEGWRTPMFC